MTNNMDRQIKRTMQDYKVTLLLRNISTYNLGRPFRNCKKIL